MKISRMISGLHNSTKATVIACSVLLAMTAVILFFLMLFPVKMRDKSAVLSAPVVTETAMTEETLPAEIFLTTTKEPPHTLSTWAATVETLTTTFDPDETTDIPWYDKIFTTSSVAYATDEYGSTVITTVPEEQNETVYVETQPAYIETEVITEMITVPEPITEAPVQTITEVVITDLAPELPPDTEPEIVNAEPVAPDFPNE
ncbi:MAG: hypothetical protein IJJ69_04890 [Oscillospiraceae bacterium]|nr:hypothetical protein [Oscillospiraceae bacterium]